MRDGGLRDTTNIILQKKVIFVEAFALKMKERKGSPVWGAELYIPGPYIKYCDNYGWVNPNMERNTPYAFSHFTYEASQRQLLIVDIQGVADQYTDPQIHAVYEKGFGLGNLGELGIQKFFETHQCKRYL